MGAVYLAEHPDIGRRVAVKVLRPELIKDAQLLLRFLNEARAANAIRHPNIIEILDSGTAPDGTPYLVMELLEGEVLSGRIQRTGKLSLGDALEFSYQTASALAAAHDKGIIHRDLKPDNLFIIPDPSDPSRERVKVLDFGIAKLQTFPTGGAMHTRTGTLMGTPVYMSPEQCLGTKTIDQRSDIYALGIIMFEMLTGRPPFLSEGFGDLVNMHLNVRPRSLREIDPAIPEPVAALVAQALEKSPDARQRSAAELQLDLRAATAGQAIVIRGVSSPNLTSGTIPGPGAGAAHAFAGATTMSTGTGERYATTIPRHATSRTRALLWGGAIAALAVGAVVMAAARRDRGTAAGQASVPPAAVTATGVKATGTLATTPVGATTAALVRLSIDSQPSEAAVVDVDSGRRLGKTPVVVERPASPRPVGLRFEKSGFEPVTRMFNLDRDHSETVSLATAADERAAAKPQKQKKALRPHRSRAAPSDEPAKL